MQISDVRSGKHRVAIFRRHSSSLACSELDGSAVAKLAIFPTRSQCRGADGMQYVPKRNANDVFEGSSTLIANEETNGCNFAETLPTEMSVNIFSKLDVRSLCSAAVTCKLWNDIIETTDSLWRGHCLTVRAVCRREVDCDRGGGFSWKVMLVRNYRKGYVKSAWLSGKFSVIRSAEEIPDNSMYPFDVETWGEILEAELER
ncbi:hypothetical protein GJAV_G00264470 [Gymnothorax javanicus]|nr:hypothetical protein GJAV_G00264470 [Gymnothorax javanicus]